MNNKIIIDVRSKMEFIGGNVAGSLNIPLQEIPQRIDEIKAMGSAIILCCARGAQKRKRDAIFEKLWNRM